MNLQRFFAPHAIAVIGVSRSQKKLGSRIYRNLRDGGFHGRLVPVNPALKRFDGSCAYATIRDVPGRIDLAIIVTPAPTVPGIVRECGMAGVRNCVVISTGFREIGAEGAERERELQTVIRRYRLNLLGPNCLGFTHGDFGMNASFGEPLARHGDIALISQSGAMAVALTDWARQTDIRFRAIVSLGNKAGLSEVEMLEYFGADPKTDAILLYLESMERGEAFCAAARRIVKHKPIVVLKAGESALGQRAAQSHTGALASSSAIFRAALASAGVMQVSHIHDLSSAATLFAHRRPMRGNRIAIVTNAGGPSIMATDALADTELSMSRFAPATTALLRARLPEAASIMNPVDCVGDADDRRYARALDAVCKDPNVDGVLVLLTPQVVTRSNATAAVIIRAAKKYAKLPIIASFLGGTSVRHARKMFADAGIPHFHYPEDAIDAFDMLWGYTNAQQTLRSQRAPRRANVRPLALKPGLVMPPFAEGMLKRYGFRVVSERFVHTDAEALRAARSLGFPLVAKVIQRKTIHKAKAGGVLLNITSKPELRSAVRSLWRRFGRPKHDDEGIMLQRMVTGRQEWFLGGKRDSSFGPVILLGLGGTDVEQNQNVMTIVPPYVDAEVRSAIRFLARRADNTEIDVAAVLAAAHALERLLRENPRVQELDINPLLVGAPKRGAVVVDARVVLAAS